MTTKQWSSVFAASLLLLPALQAGAAANSTIALWKRVDKWNSSRVDLSEKPLTLDNNCAPAPPCFNCLLPAFKCGQFGECNEYDGTCKCPPGFGGVDCLAPLCGSLADGEHRRPRPDGQECECKEGWGGINCNVCKVDNACTNFPIGGGEVANLTCYQGGVTVHHNSQMCKVTNRKILDMLPDRPPEVTFDCDKSSNTCDFQFWIGKTESFYCSLDTCTSSIKYGTDSNSTLYSCQNMKCSCITGKMLCGEDGSVDISDFLTESIHGPATFSCKTGAGCKFQEPEMNNLINDIFGDPYITLECDSGECLHFTQIPGYQRPVRPDNSRLVAFSAAGAGLIFVIASAALWYIGRTQPMKESLGQIRLPADEAARLMSEHIPASLHFSNISYSIRNRPLLEGITGSVKPGQILAIMGASGAGKSTFLDILARKQKRGIVSGTALVNGKTVDDALFHKVMGFVDQEDTLMSTLTVYETILYSALLRLPREMSFEAKKFRTLETMQELGILGIKDSRIGESGRRSISGGEKRRVSIACELVTSPSILFLDEPTSGLDAFNAFNVVECLVTLAREYNRTVIFTIHQPRSNIVSLFDQLVLLAKGKLVYSGEFSKCQAYFDSIGHPCPPGFNIADFLIDLTMQASGIPENTQTAATPGVETPPLETPVGDEEQALTRPSSSTSNSSRRHQSRSSNTQGDVTPQDEETELQTRDNTLLKSATGSIKKKTSQLLEAISSSSARRHPTISAQLASLVQSYSESDVAIAIRAEIEAASRLESASPSSDLGIAGASLQTRRRAGYGTQFRILSGRAFKNLYRNPALLAAHYISSVAIALICGLLFRNVTNDIPGFQNRLGMFFFTLSLFGFSCLSSLGLFANERILFMRERSNGYYSAFTYFASKVMFDIVPLRVVPPLVFGGIVYGLVGLVPTVAAFWKFLLTLVLFNLTTASVVLLISVVIANTAVGSLVGTLVMLFNLLFAGLLINRDSVPPSISWLHTISFYHAAFEGLAVNELRYLQLKETKYGVELDVPAATILSMFGLHAQAFWWPDIALLGVLFGTFLVSSFLYLQFYVKEKR